MKFSAFTLCLLLLCNLLSAQVLPEVRKYPYTVASYKKDSTYIKVTYSQPLKNKRKIFGNVIKYNKLWRLGADECTEITTTRDILFADSLLPAGTYSLLAIPQDSLWTVIVSKDVGMWGAFKYNPENDFLRVNIPISDPLQPYEAFTIRFYDLDKQLELQFIWDRTQVIVPLELNPKRRKED